MTTLTTSTAAATEAVVPHLWFAALLAISWGHGTSYEPRLVRGLGQDAVAIGGWLLRTQRFQHPNEAPPGFGLFDHCDTRRRCVGCELGCSSEADLIELADRSGLRVMSLAYGGRSGVPNWAQVRLWMPHSPSLSGPWQPITESQTHILRLVSPAHRSVLTPTIDGFEVADRMVPSRELNDGEWLFLQTLAPGLRTVEELFQKGEIGPLRFGGAQ